MRVPIIYSVVQVKVIVVMVRMRARGNVHVGNSRDWR